MMPSLGSHLGSSHAVAERIDSELVDRHRGAFYFGATAPDIRIVASIDREETHFFRLDEFEPQDSVAGMFEAHPHLADPALDDETRAFIAGYITHLMMDQHYIQTMYRAYFGERSSLSGDLRANVLDRALQYEMNRRQLSDLRCMEQVRSGLRRCLVPTEVGFLDTDDLERWLDVAVDIAHQPPDLERLPRMLTRHMQLAGYAPDDIERELADGEALLQEALEHVGEERVKRFLDEALELSVREVREFLRGDR